MATATRADVVRAHILRAADATDAAVETLFAELEGAALATLERDTFRGPARLALRIVDIVGE